MNETTQPQDDLDALLAQVDWVKRLARSLLRDEGAALDLSQDVLHDAIQAPSPLRGLRLRAWLGTIARRKLSRRLQRDHARRYVESEGAKAEASEPDASSRRVQLHIDLGAEIQGLEPNDREVIVAFYLEGRTQREMAEKAGVSQASMRKRVSRAKARLTERLAVSPRGRDGWTAGLLILAADAVPPAPLLPDLAEPAAHASAPAGSPAFLSSFSLVALAMKFTLPVALLAVLALVTIGPFVNGSAEGSNESVPVLANPRAGLTPEVSAATGAIDALGTSPLSERVSPKVAAAEPAVGPAVGPASTGRSVHIVSEVGGAVPGALAAWIGPTGKLQGLTVKSDGYATIPGTGAGRFFVAADEFLGRCIELDEQAQGAGGAAGARAVLSKSRIVRGRLTIDSVSPGRELELHQALFASDLGLATKESSLEVQLRALLGLDAQRTMLVDGDGGFAHRMAWDLARLKFWLPKEFLIRSIDGEEVSDGDSYVSLETDAKTHQVDLMQLPSVTGRLVWSDDGAPVTGRVELLLRHGGNDRFLEAFLSKRGEFAVSPWMDRHRFDARTVDVVELESKGEPIRVATSLRIGLSSLGLGVVHEAALDDAEFPFSLGEIVVERHPEIHVLVRGRAFLGEGDPTPIEAVLRGSNGVKKTDEHGRATLRLAYGDTLEAIAAGYRYRTVEISRAEIDLTEVIVLDLDPAPVLKIKTPTGPGALGSGTTVKARLAFDWTPFDTASLDEEDSGSPYDFALQRALHGSGFAGGGWSHAEPGAPGDAAFAIDPSGELTVAGLVPGSSFDVELTDCLDQVLVSRRVDNLQLDGASIDLSEGWADHAAELSVFVQWSDGGPVETGSIYVKGSAGRAESFAIEGGEVHLAPLALGSYHLSVGAPGAQGETFDDFELTAGAAPFKVTLHRK